jgi:hypothetical protein
LDTFTKELLEEADKCRPAPINNVRIKIIDLTGKSEEREVMETSALKK